MSASWSPTRAQLAVFAYCNLSPEQRDTDLGRQLLEAMKPPPPDYPCTASQLPSARCQEERP